MKSTIWKSALFAGSAGLLLGYSTFARTAVEETPQEVMTKACHAYEKADSVAIRALVSVDEIQDTDVKVQRDFVVDILAKKPNLFKTMTQGAVNGGVMFDGEKLSVIDSKNGFYAERNFKGDFSNLLDVTEKYDIPTPMLDLMVPNFCEATLKDVSSAKDLGTAEIDGRTLQHLLFVSKKDQVNYQVWIEKSADRYVIHKEVITSLYISEQPQYEILILSEALNPAVTAADFSWTATKNLEKVDFFDSLEDKN